MRHISKTISLNSCISKVPGTLSALSIEEKNGTEYIDFVDFSKGDILSSRTLGNYDLIVSDIELPPYIASAVTDYTDIYVNIRKNNSDDYYDIEKISYDIIKKKYAKDETYYFYYGRDIYSIVWDDEDGSLSIEDIVKKATKHKYLSYSTLHSWYIFFKKYYQILNSGTNKVPYKNAADYYKYELVGKTNESKETYEKYDKIVESRGGQVTYNWIKDNCIEIYELPKQYREANGFSYLYYPQALKFFLELDKLHSQFSNISSIEECKETSGYCCDCMDYIKRGGNNLYEDLKKWIEGIKAEGNEIKTASISIPLMLTTNIDDLGEMSIFSNEYKVRTDYTPTIDEAHKINNSIGGTVIHRPIITNEETGDIFIDNNSYIIKEGCKGFKQNKYKENVFNRDDWADYTVKYINDHTDEFVSDNTIFAYKRDGSIIYNPTDEDMLEKYNAVLYDNGCVLYNGNIIEIVKKKYVVYSGLTNSLLNGFTFPVETDALGNCYTLINGRFFYASKKADGNYYFNFTKPNKCHDLSEYSSQVQPTNADGQRLLILNNSVYPIDDNTSAITIADINENTDVKYEYKILDGYVIIDNVTYYIIGRKLYSYEGFELNANSNESQKFEEANPGWVSNKRFPLLVGKEVEIMYPYKKWRTDFVSGHTDSKLQDLRITNVLTDDLGNEMPGFYQNKNSTYSQPYEGCLLDMYYKPGNVSQLTKNSYLTVDDVYTMQYFDGNILQSMQFYYTVDGEPYYDGAVEIDNDMPSEIRENVLSAINLCDENLEIYLSEKTNNDTYFQTHFYSGKCSPNYDTQLHCVFTYYMGAILHERICLGNDKLYTYDGYELARGMNHGVKYVEDNVITKDKCIYRLLDGSCMYLSYYKITQNERNVTLNSYDNQTAKIYDAQFSADIRFFTLNDKNEVEVSRNEFSYENGFNQLNNMVATPVFRKNYDFGISFTQNVNSNIYIDRGINKAFDKHLRLQEIKSMEALENYQNGQAFNVIEI